jgi:hypothetical protein
VPTELGALDTPGFARDVVVSGGLAYVADSDSGLRIIDVNDSAAPLELGVVDSFATDVEVSGNLAYIADAVTGLRIVDVADPMAPIERFNLLLNQSANEVEIVDDRVYLVIDSFGVLILDVAIAANPVFLSLVNLPGAVGIAVLDGLAYVTESGFSGGLRIFDVADPALPVRIGALDFRGAFAIEVADGLAYVTDDDERLRIVDVREPAAPHELSALDLPEDAPDVELLSGLVYVADSFNGLRVIDSSEPKAPEELGAFRTPEPLLAGIGFAEGIALASGLVYLADGTKGLRIIDLGPEYSGAARVSIDIEPGSDPNAINPFSRGVIPVAILGSDAFDVADVDATTLAFGPAGAALAHREGPHFEDVDEDGFMDLLGHYRTQEAGIAFGDEEACLTGETVDATPFEGCDAIVTVPGCGLGFELAVILPGLMCLRRRRRQ